MLAEKLDFLMKLTETQNSTLGRVLNFDASYISRIRNGKRGAPKHQPFIEPAAAYFARRIAQPYQKQAAAEMISQQAVWPDSEEDARKLIEAWLRTEENIENHPVGQFLSGLSALGEARHAPKGAGVPEPYLPGELSALRTSPLSQTAFFYGNDGKRRAVELFLSQLCALEAPQTLLLYSDEDFSWLYEDVAFAGRWAALLSQLIANGSRIRIIHTISRGIHDMLEALQKWLPLYVTGAIEPYFYPRIRDGVYHRTLFIARGRLALTACSVEAHRDNALNLLIDNAAAVGALELEFNDYFSLCRPLVTIYSPREYDALLDALAKLEGRDGQLMIAHSSPAFFTMPHAVFDSLMQRLLKEDPPSATNLDAARITAYYAESAESFAHRLNRGWRVTEIMHLPNQSDIRDGRVPIPLCSLPGRPPLYYTAGEFRMHLMAVIELLKTDEHYEVFLSDSLPENISLYCMDEAGTILLRPLSPGTALEVSEQRMNASFWEYLRRICENEGQKRSRTINQLELYVQKLI